MVVRPAFQTRRDPTKIRNIVHVPYPDMSAVTDAILDLDQTTLSQSWRETVRTMTGR